MDEIIFVLNLKQALRIDFLTEMVMWQRKYEAAKLRAI